MKTNNIHDRLKLYELALVDYESSLGQGIIYKDINNTFLGFCHYFNYKHGVNIFYSFEKDLPELFETKPIRRHIFWFEDGEIEPRIECLKKAIEITKQKINDGQTN